MTAVVTPENESFPRNVRKESRGFSRRIRFGIGSGPFVSAFSDKPPGVFPGERKPAEHIGDPAAAFPSSPPEVGAGIKEVAIDRRFSVFYKVVDFTMILLSVAHSSRDNGNDKFFSV
jgi:hypothetical protein